MPIRWQAKQAALARDQLVAFTGRSDNDRLKQALLADAGGEVFKGAILLACIQLLPRVLCGNGNPINLDFPNFHDRSSGRDGPGQELQNRPTSYTGIMSQAQPRG